MQKLITIALLAAAGALAQTPPVIPLPPVSGTQYGPICKLSGAQTNGYVLTATGTNSCAWQPAGGGSGISTYTVSTLPASPTALTLAVVTDGNPGCSAGGGTNRAWCQYSSGWKDIGPVGYIDEAWTATGTIAQYSLVKLDTTQGRVIQLTVSDTKWHGVAMNAATNGQAVTVRRFGNAPVLADGNIALNDAVIVSTTNAGHVQDGGSSRDLVGELVGAATATSAVTGCPGSCSSTTVNVEFAGSERGTKVTTIQGKSVNGAPSTAGQKLQYDGTQLNWTNGLVFQVVRGPGTAACNAAETALDTVTVPAGTIVAGDVVEIQVYSSHTGTTSAPTFKVEVNANTATPVATVVVATTDTIEPSTTRFRVNSTSSFVGAGWWTRANGSSSITPFSLTDNLIGSSWTVRATETTCSSPDTMNTAFMVLSVFRP